MKSKSNQTGPTLVPRALRGFTRRARHIASRCIDMEPAQRLELWTC